MEKMIRCSSMFSVDFFMMVGKILRIVLGESSECIGNEPTAERPQGWSQWRLVLYLKKQDGKTSACIWFFFLPVLILFDLLQQEERVNINRKKKGQFLFLCFSVLKRVRNMITCYQQQELLIKEWTLIFVFTWVFVLYFLKPHPTTCHLLNLPHFKRYAEGIVQKDIEVPIMFTENCFLLTYTGTLKNFMPVGI